MPTLNSVTKTARITGSDWEVIERYMNEQEITFSGWVKIKAEEMCQPQGVTPDSDGLSRYGLTTSIIADFDGMLKLYDMDFGDFFKILHDRISNCEIDIGELINAE